MNKVKRILAKGSASVVVLLTVPSSVGAAFWPDFGTSYTNLDDIIRVGLNTAIILAAVVAVAFLIYNGIQYMISSGDAAKTEEAQKGIANALIGLVVCLVAAVVVQFVLRRLEADTPSTVDAAMTILLS